MSLSGGTWRQRWEETRAPQTLGLAPGYHDLSAGSSTSGPRAEQCTEGATAGERTGREKEGIWKTRVQEKGK